MKDVRPAMSWQRGWEVMLPPLRQGMCKASSVLLLPQSEERDVGGLSGTSDGAPQQMRRWQCRALDLPKT